MKEIVEYKVCINIANMVQVLQSHGGYTAVEVGSGSEHTILVVGTVGSGKSVLVNSWATNLKHFKKYKVIYFTEKSDSPMENAFCGIETDNTQQIKNLLNDGVEHSQLPKREEIEIYHPFTFNFPKNNVPDPLKFFTFSLKDINIVALSALLSRDVDSPTTLLCEDVIKDLSKVDNIYSFVFKAFEKSISEEEISKISSSRSMQGMGSPVESYGSKRDFEQIRKIFSKFNQHYLLQNDKCEMNMTEKKIKDIINDRTVTTLFTMWKIDDDRIKYFIYIQLLLMINNVVREKKNYPLLIILEEIKILLPKTASTDVEETLIKILRNLMSGMRSTGTTFIATTQSYFETNKEFRSTINDVLLMKLNAEDLRQFAQAYPMSANNMKLLSTLGSGQVVLFNELMQTDKDETVKKYRAFYVPYAHREKDKGTEAFVSYWKQRYPEKIINFKDTLNRMGKEQLQDFEKQLKMQEEYISKIKNQKTENKQKYKDSVEKTEEFPIILPDRIIKEKRTRKKQVEIQPENEIVNSIKQENQNINTNDDINKKCYDIANATETISWANRTILVEGISVEDMQKNAINYALTKKDYRFIKKFCDKDVVDRYFPEIAGEV